MWGLGSIVKTRLRSADTGEDEKWRNETDAQIGYGEITKGYMTQILNILEHITDRVPPSKRCMHIKPIEKYNISSESRFLDVGSGFGKPVFHAAMQIGCESKGIEVVPARVDFCKEFLKKIHHSKTK